MQLSIVVKELTPSVKLSKKFLICVHNYWRQE